MDLMAGAAILVSRIGIAGFDRIEGYASSNTLAEDGTRVTERTRIAAAFLEEGCTGAMQGLFPGGFLAGNDSCVVVAFSTGEICRYSRFTGRASRTGGASRTGRTGFTLGAGAGCEEYSGYNQDTEQDEHFLY
jgi:hypothetical protein